MKKICYILIMILTAPLLTGCLEETFPTSTATKGQIAGSDESLEAMNRATAAYMQHMGADASSCGYGGMMIWHDVMLQDQPVNPENIGIDSYYWGFATTTYCGDWLIQEDFWIFYYRVVQYANLLIGMVNPEEASAQALAYLGNALTYRAFAYMNMARLYEFKRTGVADLDQRAEPIMKLTVPIVTENTTEAEGRNNPRAPFYKMYRFIMNDLNRAETYLHGYSRADASEANESVVYGMKARLYLELATRFEKYPEDLATQLEHESDSELAQYDPLGITQNAVYECYEKAAQYARLAQTGGYSPLTESEWHDTTTGFNTVNHSWMFAIIMGSEDEGVASWKSFAGNMASEQQFGMTYYGVYRLIGRSLYDAIPTTDWRKRSWIDPADAGDASTASKYSTQLSGSAWAALPAYANLKFRPGNGDLSDYQTGSVVDIPLMRVEEMYFIEAEAKAYTEGVSAGLNVLKSLVQTRNPSYNPTVAGRDAFIKELILQKRIEFWGEGILVWDYKRLELQVVRGYEGTNYPDAYCYNSPGVDGQAVAPWINVFITSSETIYNPAIEKNPDPSDCGVKWE